MYILMHLNDNYLNWLDHILSEIVKAEILFFAAGTGHHT